MSSSQMQLNYGSSGIAAGASFPELSDDGQKKSWIAIGVLALGLILVYLDTLARVSTVWDSPQYSHGFLIPFFALALLAIRREPFRDVPVWHRWVGVGLIVLGIAIRVVGGATVIFIADNLSFIPCLIGIFVLVGGLPTLSWASPALIFLVFMYPFPRVMEEKVMHPLQRLATMCSNIVLVTLGVDSVREGNLIHLASRPDPMNVAEQC